MQNAKEHLNMALWLFTFVNIYAIHAEASRENAYIIHVSSNPVLFGDGSALKPFGSVHDASQHVRALRAAGKASLL